MALFTCPPSADAGVLTSSWSRSLLFRLGILTIYGARFLKQSKEEMFSLPLLKGKRPPFFMLKYTGDKSWAAFVRNTLNWNIQEIKGHYQIVGHRVRPDGSWAEDLDHKIVFPPDTPIDVVVDRMVALLQDAIRRQNN